MTPRISVPLALLLAALALSGCVQRHGDLAFVTSRNVDLSGEFEMVQRGVVGKDLKQIIVIIPTGTPNLEEAIDAALEKTSADYLTNAKLYYIWWMLPGIFAEYGYKVVGDAWKKVEEPVSD